MWPYWLMFLVPAWATLQSGRLKPEQARYMWFVVGLLFALVIGFRDHIGGDWGTYARHFRDVSNGSLGAALGRTDPGYYGLNWLVAYLGGDIHHLNFLCACVLMWGTVRFCRAQYSPWLALVAAVPYMLIVVGMGYSRQSVALGFALLGLEALGHRKVRSFVIWVCIGAAFHKSAVLLLPIAALASSRSRLMTGGLVALMTVLMYYLLLRDSTDALWQNYVEANYQSAGGLIRALMNMVPAVLFLLYRKRLAPDPAERKLWVLVSCLALSCLVVVQFSSTAVDRLALYLLPLQLFVFPRMPRLAPTVIKRTPLVLGVVVYYACVQYVWLNYGQNTYYWVPYKFMPLWW